MSGVIRPSSLDGIKRLAKSIKKARKLQHTTALDAAAREAGYDNFRHARRLLASTKNREVPTSAAPFFLFLTAYWEDGGTLSRETVRLRLSKPFEDLLAPRVRRTSLLRAFRREAADHLVWQGTLDSSRGARTRLCKAARFMQFVNATELAPSSSSSHGSRIIERLPNRDHVQIWVDRSTQQVVITDEPYLTAVDPAARAVWAEANGFVVVPSPWRGIHNPHGAFAGTQMYLIAERAAGGLLNALIQRLRAADEPITPDAWEVGREEARWSVESASGAPRFRSPLMSAAPTRRNSSSRTSQGARGARNSVEYSMVLASGRRPSSSMPIAVHAEVGRLIKAVLAMSRHRAGVTNQLNAVRSRLDDWVQHEYDDDSLPAQQFFGLYYREQDLRDVRAPSDEERDQALQQLDGVQRLLTEHYPPCAPVRDLLRRLNAAIQSLAKWRVRAA